MGGQCLVETPSPGKQADLGGQKGKGDTRGRSASSTTSARD